MVERLPARQRDALAQRWCDQWRAAAPGCRPQRALDALAPVAPLRNAAAYAGFLDRIEPSEHVYHRDDVPECLEQARGHR
jgi:hypothetical protein